MLAKPNLRRLQGLLEEARLDAVVVGSPISVRYLTGYHWWLDGLFREYMMEPGASDALLTNTFVVVPRGGDPVLVAPAFLAGNATDDARVHVRDIRFFGVVPFEVVSAASMSDHPADPSGPPLSDVVAALASELDLSQGRVGIESRAIGRLARANLDDAVGEGRFVDATNLMRLLRAVKTREEVEVMRMAGTIAEAGAISMLESATPETSMEEVTAAFRQKVTALGADFEHVVYSVHGRGLGANPALNLGHTECTSVDYGCIYQGYFSDGGTTIISGDISDSVRNRWDAVASCVERGAAAMHPGQLASSVQKVMQESLNDDGITGSTLPHGHGLGLDVRDYPILMPPTGLRIADGAIDVSSDLMLEEGMVVNLEASILLPDIGSVHYERTFVIEESGSVMLMDQPREPTMIA